MKFDKKEMRKRLDELAFRTLVMRNNVETDCH